MNQTPADARCPRSWEVEAVRDGRLREQDAESLRRHLGTCAACQREESELGALARGLGALPAPRLDALARRRVRQRVLTAHNAWLLRQEHAGTSWRRRLAWVAAAAALALGGVVASRHLPRAAEPAAGVTLAGSAPVVEVVASPGTRWSRRTAAHELEVTLQSGELALSIRRGAPKDRVVIRLPDGEIEDLGTVLHVVVTDGATDSVRVDQGRVLLRLREQAPVSLNAGQRWQRAARLVVPGAGAALRASESPEPRGPALRVEAPARHAGTPKPHGAPLPAAASAPAAASLGADASAARAEDEAYLHVLELVRSGKVDAARTAAKDYLLRFPNGFRRVEVLNIATDPPELERRP